MGFYQSGLWQWVAVFLMLVAWHAQAQPQLLKTESAASSSQDWPEQVTLGVVVQTLGELGHMQAWMGGYVGWAGRKLDALISNSAAVDEENGSRMVLLLPYRVHADTSQYVTPRVNAILDLPNTNRKWKLFVSSFNEEKDQRQVSAQVDQENTQTQVGVQVQLKKTLDLLNLLDFGFNAKGLGLPTVYMRYKSIYYQQFPLE